MSIPKIASYPMPDLNKLPESRMSWQPDPARAALLLHDVQDYFLEFFDVEAAPIPTLIANLVAIRDRCDELGIPVFYTAQPGQQTDEQRGILNKFWGAGVTAQPDKAGIFAPLAPKPHHQVLDKWRYSAFQRSPFESLLREAGRDQLIIGGVYAHIGILMSAGEAFMRDIHPCVVGDAVADFNAARHETALDTMVAMCASVSSTADLLTALPAPQAEAKSLRERLALLLEVEASSIAADDNLIDLGLDSIRLMTLLGELQAEGHTVSLEYLAEQPTLNAWNALLALSKAEVLEDIPRAA